MTGHAAASMTVHYTHSDVDRRRQGVETIAERLVDRGGPVQ